MHSENMVRRPVLWLVIPCYNEEAVLPVMGPVFLAKLQALIRAGQIAAESRVLFVNDGSTDRTWELIEGLAAENAAALGLCLSRNRGHQSALLAGLMEAKEHCDITISIDCDGQDDLGAMDEMIREYGSGCEIVYGVRSDRSSDTFFKRRSAELYYRFLRVMGAEVVYNSADYRLVSSRVLQEFADFKEVNLYLRGMFPLVGFKSTAVYYERHERVAGRTHYPLHRMLSLAFDGITSLSIRPIRIVAALGAIVAGLGFIGVLWAILTALTGHAITGWASTICVICFLGGVQLLGIGIVGEYVGKTYLETKHRPRYIISERTWEDDAEEIAPHIAAAAETGASDQVQGVVKAAKGDGAKARRAMTAAKADTGQRALRRTTAAQGDGSDDENE